MKNTSATLIQSHVRSFLARKDYQRQIRYISFVQDKWRSILLCRRTRQQYVRSYNAIVTIQRLVKQKQSMTREHQLHQHNAAVCIAAWYKMIKDRKAFVLLRLTVVKLQQRWRANKLAKVNRVAFVTKRNACLLIQSVYREHLVRQALQREMLVKQNEAATLIQSLYRMRQDKAKFIAIKSACCLLQVGYIHLFICSFFKNY